MTSIEHVRGTPTYAPVARLHDLPPGTPVSRRLPDGTSVVLVNLAGEIFALADRCSHEALELSAGDVCPDGTIECVWHGARFDCRTGEAIHPPAVEPVPVYEVRVDGEVVLVGPRRTVR
jgi:3-phenylpropionate/trans-cinnamate dioxygenase ferredoxin subunit